MEIGAGVIVENNRGQVLVIEQDGKVCFPAGHWEPGESLFNTAIREVGEECGLGVDLYHLLGIFQVGDVALGPVFVAVVVSGDIRPGVGITTALWARPEDLLRGDHGVLWDHMDDLLVAYSNGVRFPLSAYTFLS